MQRGFTLGDGVVRAAHENAWIVPLHGNYIFPEFASVSIDHDIVGIPAKEVTFSIFET